MPFSTVLRRLARRTAIALVLAGLARHAMAEDAAFEQALRAAYLYNFSLYTEWPGAPGNNLGICILGRPALGNALDALAGKTVRGRQVVILRVDGSGDLGACHVLYVGQMTAALRHRLSRPNNPLRLLTVAEADMADEFQPIVTLLPEGSRLAFEVDLTSARAHGLVLSAKLLRLARTVR